MAHAFAARTQGGNAEAQSAIAALPHLGALCALTRVTSHEGVIGPDSVTREFEADMAVTRMAIGAVDREFTGVHLGQVGADVVVVLVMSAADVAEGGDAE